MQWRLIGKPAIPLCAMAPESERGHGLLPKIEFPALKSPRRIVTLRPCHASRRRIRSRGFTDVIGVALLAAALLLLVAQLSFDRYDLSFFKDPHNKPVHNWIGPFGAYLAWGSFFPFWRGGIPFAVVVCGIWGGVSAEFSGLPARAAALVGAVVGGAGDLARPACFTCWTARAGWEISASPSVRKAPAAGWDS